MSEQFLVTYCSPTLAGIKIANLFRYKYTSKDELHNKILEYNNQLNSKGLYIDILKISNEYALVYVYRKNKLRDILKKPEVISLLVKFGYTENNVDYCIDKLKERMIFQNDFPHEIGLFLGYPFEDVIGFIENKGQNSQYTGPWKVYCNKCDKIKLFQKFKKCHDIYIQLFKSGKSVIQLTVPA